MNVYEYIIDEIEDNQILEENMEVDVTPILIFYKDKNYQESQKLKSVVID